MIWIAYMLFKQTGTKFFPHSSDAQFFKGISNDQIDRSPAVLL